MFIPRLEGIDSIETLVAVAVWGVTFFALYYLWERLQGSQWLEKKLPKWSKEKIDFFETRVIASFVFALLLVALSIVVVCKGGGLKSLCLLLATALDFLLWTPIFLGLDCLWKRKRKKDKSPKTKKWDKGVWSDRAVARVIDLIIFCWIVFSIVLKLAFVRW